MNEVQSPQLSLLNLVQNYEGVVRKHLARSACSQFDIDDIYHDLLVRAAEHKRSVEIRSTYSYVLKILENMLRDRRRRQVVRHYDQHISMELDVVGDMPCTRHDPEATAHYRLQFDKVVEHIRELRPQTQRALILNRLEGLSYAQVAAEMDISTSMVQKHISAGIKHLKQCLPGTFRYDA